MPVFILVRQILGINADDGIAILASVGEDGLITLDAIRMVILKDISLAGQGIVTLPTAEVARMPVFGHGLRVLPAENELFTFLGFLKVVCGSFLYFSHCRV